MERAGHDPAPSGPTHERCARIGAFVELHVEQGRALADTADPVGVASAIWPHGRWRFDFRGEANHAGTTRLEDRRDPMLAYAATVLAARGNAERPGALATFGKISVEPNGINAIPSLVSAWLDSRAADEAAAGRLVEEIAAAPSAGGRRRRGRVRESFTPTVDFDLPCATASRACSAARPCCPPARGTTRASSPARSRPPCCSCATPPASRTRRTSTPRKPTASPGSPPSPPSWRTCSRRPATVSARLPERADGLAAGHAEVVVRTFKVMEAATGIQKSRGIRSWSWQSRNRRSVRAKTEIPVFPGLYAF